VGRSDDFMRYGRLDPPKRPASERVRDGREFTGSLSDEELRTQAARCMDCGIPFCHQFGCPVKNLIPDWNDSVYRQHGRRALDLLHATNNLPEVTGRICPAPCEPACTLAINQDPVLIKHIELRIVENGWERGWIEPQRPPFRTGKRAAVVGSGPAGLSAAQQLARAGHEVIVFEKAARAGGLLRFGIPDFKLEKWVLDRRLDQMRSEGVIFETDVEAGVDISVRYLRRTFDAVLIAIGAGVPRDLRIPGRELSGIHFAMDYLTQQNRRTAGERIPAEQEITAEGKNVVVIGGGDTGSDCIGTARRQGARRVVQLEILPAPPRERPAGNPWPTWPRTYSTTSSQEEGCTRMYGVATEAFLGEAGSVRSLRCVRSGPGDQEPAFEVSAELVLLAMGFLHPEDGPLSRDYALRRDERGNLCVDARFMTAGEGVFSSGDSVMGASLVVRAIDQGRRAAACMHRYLTA